MLTARRCCIQGRLAPVVSRWEKAVPTTGLGENRWLRYPSQLKSNNFFPLIPSFNFWIVQSQSWATPSTSRNSSKTPACCFSGHVFIPPHYHRPAYLPPTATTYSGFEKPNAKQQFPLWLLLPGNSSSSAVSLAGCVGRAPPHCSSSQQATALPSRVCWLHPILSPSFHSSSS